jgi:hypothetical protein
MSFFNSLRTNPFDPQARAPPLCDPGPRRDYASPITSVTLPMGSQPGYVAKEVWKATAASVASRIRYQQANSGVGESGES